MAHFLLFLCGILSLAFPASAATHWDGWPFAWFRTGHWQPPHITLRQIGTNQDPGKIFLSVRNDNLEDGTAPTIYDSNGDMVWQGPHEKTMDFKMQKLFGKDVITYWDGETGVLGYGYGQVHILDDTYKEIYTVTLQDDFVTPNGVPRESYVDVHEHIITPNNTMIVSAINITTTDCSDAPDGREDMYVIDALFYEIDIATNEVLFKWDALEHPDKIPMGKIKQGVWGGDSPEHPWDCFHMNSVHPTKDGYLVSIRYLWSALYIERDGSVRWQLSGSEEDEGDFQSTDVKFSWQHDARVHAETDDHLVLSLFNNAATRYTEDNQTQGVVIDVDTKNMVAKSLYKLADPEDPLITRTQGSLQLLGEPGKSNMMIGYGSVPKFKEYDVDGNVVLRGHFGGGKAQAYRAFKYDWHATPYYNPRIAIRHPSVYTTDVYMSWNGATDYDNWVIYSMPAMNATRDQGSLVARVPRMGFESHVAFESTNPKYIMAVARQGSRVLRSSPIVEFGHFEHGR